MNRLKFLFSLLTLSALLLGSPDNSLARTDGGPALAGPTSSDEGRLILKLSPAVGINVGISVRIDGRTAGVVARGQIYERTLPPGRHLVQVFGNGHGREAWAGILDFSNGRTHAFVVNFGDRVSLQAIAVP